MGARDIFSGDFRSYMSGNKPLTCGDAYFGISSATRDLPTPPF